MRQTRGLIVRDEIQAGGWQIVTIRQPELAVRVVPGQLLAVRSDLSPFEPLLRVPLPVAGADSAGGTVDFVNAPGNSWQISSGPGAAVDILGPVGRGWTLHDRTRNAVLLGTDLNVGPLLFLAAAGTARSWNVALLVGAPAECPALPASLVPPSVEYQFARGDDASAAALDLLDADLLRWADDIYTTLPIAAYPQLADRVRRVRMRWERGDAQGLLQPPMACFSGVCDVCVVPEARHTWRACADGPQCDLRDFVR